MNQRVNLLVKIVLWKPVKKERKFHCVATTKCTKIFKSQATVNRHIIGAHPTFRFKCQYCKLTFQTSNGKYKHEITHAPPRFECEYVNCNKHFHYKCSLEEHQKTHTGVGLIPCVGKKCGRKFTSNHAIRAHAIIHSGKKFNCSAYTESFATKLYLDQHYQGAHSGGWQALCGLKFKWLKGMHKHEDHCKKCCSINVKINQKWNQIRSTIKSKHLSVQEKINCLLCSALYKYPLCKTS